MSGTDPALDDGAVAFWSCDQTTTLGQIRSDRQHT